MAIRIPKPVAAAPTPAAAPPLTRDDVQSMLDANNAQWTRQLAAVTQAFAISIADMKKPQPQPLPPPRQGSTIKFKYDERGQIVGADLTPKE